MVNTPRTGNFSYRAGSVQKKLYLSPAATELLAQESRTAGLSMSVVVEQLIRKHCGKPPKPAPKPREKRFVFNG